MEVVDFDNEKIQIEKDGKKRSAFRRNSKSRR